MLVLVRCKEEKRKVTTAGVAWPPSRGETQPPGTEKNGAELHVYLA